MCTPKFNVFDNGFAYAFGRSSEVGYAVGLNFTFARWHGPGNVENVFQACAGAPYPLSWSLSKQLWICVSGTAKRSKVVSRHKANQCKQTHVVPSRPAPTRLHSEWFQITSHAVLAFGTLSKIILSQRLRATCAGQTGPCKRSGLASLKSHVVHSV